MTIENFAPGEEPGGDAFANHHHALYEVHAVAEQHTLDVPWEPGMVAVVDNLRVMHGRRAYQDRGRDIIMRLGLDPISGPAAAQAAE